MAFPYYFEFEGHRLHPHTVFEGMAYVVAAALYLGLRRHFGDAIPTPIRWTVVAAAVAGATLGSKLLYWLEDPQATLLHRNDVAYLMGGKTIVGALVFGMMAVEIMKRYIGLEQSTGDLYAIPLALGIAIGRIGCFLTGLADNTYGVATSLPWGVDFGDGVFELPAAHNAWADRVDPVFRDAFDMLLALDHEGERPNRVALALSAMTRRLATTPVGQSQGARQAIGRHLETGEELAFSPAKQRC